jgi:hypothetical protein
MDYARSMHGDEKFIQNLKGRDHLGDPGIVEE